VKKEEKTMVLTKLEDYQDAGTSHAALDYYSWVSLFVLLRQNKLFVY
jgi:hypothetical protein